jgi:hypothetical protein
VRVNAGSAFFVTISSQRLDLLVNLASRIFLFLGLGCAIFLLMHQKQIIVTRVKIRNNK